LMRFGVPFTETSDSTTAEVAQMQMFFIFLSGLMLLISEADPALLPLPIYLIRSAAMQRQKVPLLAGGIAPVAAIKHVQTIISKYQTRATYIAQCIPVGWRCIQVD